LVTTILIMATMIPVGLIKAAPRDPVGPPDRRSGFYSFESFSETIPSGSSGPGRGTITGVVCVTSTSTQPSDFAGNYLLNCDGVGPHNETTIAVNPNNAANIIAGSHSYLLSVQGNTLTAHIIAAAYASSDGGTSWTNVHPPLGSWQFTGDPVMFFDGVGRAYFVNLGDHEGQSGAYTNVSVIAQRSDDGGLTWTDPVTVAAGAGAVSPGGLQVVIFNDKPWGTADTTGGPRANWVYVTYTRFLFVHNSYIESPIYFSRSSDGGKTWSVPKEISGSSSTLCTQQVDSSGGASRCDENQFSQPVVAADGTLYVSFFNEQNPASTDFRDQVLVVKSTDGGTTWSGPYAASPIIHDGANDYPLNSDGRQRLTGCAYRVNASGALAADPTNSSRLYYTYTENQTPGTAGPTQTDIMVVRSDNGGATWSSPIVVNSSAANQVYSWAAVDGNGFLRVGYVDHNRPPVGAQTCVYGYTLSTATSVPAAAFTHSNAETGLSIASNSRWFGQNTRFIGDYTNVAVGPDGFVWMDWTDMRQDTTFLGVTRKDQDAVGMKKP
jgi:hypothetical protein